MFILAMMTMILQLPTLLSLLLISQFRFADCQAGRFTVHRGKQLHGWGRGNGIGRYPHCQPIFQAQWKKIEDIYYVCETVTLMY